MGCHPQRQAGLPHAGPPRNDHEIGGLESRRDVIEIVKACGNARDMFFPLRQFIDEIETFLDDGINRSERSIQFPLNDAEHRSFRKIEQVVDGRRAFISSREHFRRGMDQLPEQRFVAHDLAVIANIGRAGDALVRVPLNRRLPRRLQFLLAPSTVPSA